jgi:hypothetical protein
MRKISTTPALTSGRWPSASLCWPGQNWGHTRRMARTTVSGGSSRCGESAKRPASHSRRCLRQPPSSSPDSDSVWPTFAMSYATGRSSIPPAQSSVDSYGRRFVLWAVLDNVTITMFAEVQRVHDEIVRWTE